MDYSRSFSMLLLAILLLGLQNAAEAQQGINEFCKTATTKQLCTKMVNGATNFKDATINSINVAIDMAKKIQELTPLVVEATNSLDPGMKSQLTELCTESFANTIEDLTLSIDYVKQGDIGSVGTRLSAAFDSTCLDSLKERGVNVPAVSKLQGHFGKLMDNCLAVALQN